jgi:hypothetical protein
MLGDFPAGEVYSHERLLVPPVVACLFFFNTCSAAPLDMIGEGSAHPGLRRGW